MENKRRPRPRLNIVMKTARTRRIFDRLREGWAYDDIAQAERLSAERIRQIVTRVLEQRYVDTSNNHAHLQNERLRPASKLVTAAVVRGEMRAVSPLIKLIDRLDRHRIVFKRTPETEEDYRQKLLDKLNFYAANLEAYEEDDELKAFAEGSRVPDGDTGSPADRVEKGEAAGPADFFARGTRASD